LEHLKAVTKVSDHTAHALKKAMQVMEEQPDFLDSQGIPKNNSNFQLVDRAKDGKCSLIRARRPISQKFAQRVTDIYDACLSKPERYDLAKDFPDKESYPALLELKQVYSTAKKDVPKVVEDRLKEMVTTFAGIRANEGSYLRDEMKLVVGPVDFESFPTDDGPFAEFSMVSVANHKEMTTLAQLCQDVYGCPISTVAAPLLFLQKHSSKSAEDIKILLGLRPKQEEKKACAKPTKACHAADVFMIDSSEDEKAGKTAKAGKTVKAGKTAKEDGYEEDEKKDGDEDHLKKDGKKKEAKKEKTNRHKRASTPTQMFAYPQQPIITPGVYAQQPFFGYQYPQYPQAQPMFYPSQNQYYPNKKKHDHSESDAED
jgi:hypothetical protein